MPSTFPGVNWLAVFLACLSFFAAVALASAHPTIDNSMEVVVHADHVSIRAKISLPEIDIAHRIDEDSSARTIDAAKLKKAIDDHGPYLLSHLQVTADDKPVEGKLVSASPPAGEATWARLEQLAAV